MKRREVLKNLGMGVTASLVLPTWLSSCSKDDEGPEVKYDGVVGIVGAGAAGLAVADYLISKGIRVKVFEASDRVGGRIQPLRQSHPVFNELAADFPVELGADRVFGTNSEFGNIIKLLKVPTDKFRKAPTNAADYYMIDGEYLPAGSLDLPTEFITLKEYVFGEGQFEAYTGGGTVQSAIPTSSELQPVLNSWLGNAYGTSIDRIGANALAEGLSLIEHDKEEFMLTTNPISDVLTKQYNKAFKKVQLNSPIKNINYSDPNGNITLTLEGGSQEVVTKLVVTSPVTVLKDSSKMDFTPSLPASKVDALSRIGMDASMRIVIEFARNNFFQVPDGMDANAGPKPAFIYGGVECPAYFFGGAGRSKKNITVCLTVNGPKAEELSTLLGPPLLDPKDSYPEANMKLVLDKVLSEMDIVFDGKATQYVRRREVVPPATEGTIISVIKDWTMVPYIGGAQSYPLPGGTNADREELAAAIDARIFFAGEATDTTGEFGTISGAIKSGERAAQEVVTAILEENAAS